ncbi:MAG TPA: amino acid ABC transporter, partial [Pantoea agglomerans]|nr:amino acid ABC transporter [Pantoea agglomerans]
MTKRATALIVALGLTASLAQAADAIPVQKVDQALHDRLPDEIKKSGKMISVNNGSFPPYEIVNGPHSMEGASAELTTALAQLLGVKIEHA